jgi:hypothetical protein
MISARALARVSRAGSGRAGCARESRARAVKPSPCVPSADPGSPALPLSPSPLANAGTFASAASPSAEEVRCVKSDPTCGACAAAMRGAFDRSWLPFSLTIASFRRPLPPHAPQMERKYLLGNYSSDGVRLAPGLVIERGACTGTGPLARPAQSFELACATPHSPPPPP